MRRIHSALFITVSLLLAACGGDKNPGLDGNKSPATWAKTVGGDEFEQANAIVSVPGGGYLIAGTIGLGEAMDVYLVKINGDGAVLWEQSIGGSGLDDALSLTKTADGGYLIAGSTSSIGYGEVDAYLLKVDATGDKVWEHAYGGSADDNAVFAAPLADGYVVMGSALGIDASSTKVVIITTDPIGQLRERQVAGGDGAAEAYAGAATSDGGAIVAGVSQIDGHTYPDVYLLRLGADGGVLWESTYGGDRAIRPLSIASVSGGFAIAGDVIESGMSESNAYLAKIDNSGNLLWEQTFGSNHNDELHCVVPTDDGGFILAGWTLATLARGTDAYLVKTDASGNVLWERTFGGDSFDEAFGVVPTPEGGYLLVGRTASFGTGGGDFYLIKTDAMGQVSEPD
jgi:hypothetical protein